MLPQQVLLPRENGGHHVRSWALPRQLLGADGRQLARAEAKFFPVGAEQQAAMEERWRRDAAAAAAGESSPALSVSQRWGGAGIGVSTPAAGAWAGAPAARASRSRPASAGRKERRDFTD